jgi:glycosyltransferase involved in cell wall biosynthesis
MKIAQVTGFFMPKKYGSNELFLCRELTNRGHSVTVFTAARPRQEYAMLSETKDERSVEIYENFTIKRFPSKFRVRDIQIMPDLFRALANEEFDIIHAHEFFSPSAFYSGLVTATRHTPLVITQHNDQLPVVPLNKYLYYVDACTVGAYSLKQARKIIALTKAIRRHLLLFGASSGKIDIIPNAIDTNKFVPDNKNLLKEKWNLSTPIILYVGRFSEVKGIRILLKAFPVILKALPEVKLVLVGGGPLEAEIVAVEKQHPGHIIRLSFVPNDIMPYIYTGCDLVVLPSLEERFGNVTLEAMASGKPVVGSGIGGMLDTISHEKTGLHVPPGNSNQLSEAVIRIMKNDSFKQELGQNARKKVLKEYSSNVVVKRVEQLYIDALS